ncbi:MAG TPA: hypothetical protein VMG82_36785 [Candidatus Sulfotelmatobacter sp.]|nr:hypothetical protein [Candidatus Sulfotelmatobacter sp.]
MWFGLNLWKEKAGIAAFYETGDPEENYARSKLGGARGARMTVDDDAFDITTAAA